MQALDVAVHFVEYSGRTKTNLQVIKLSYIAHGFMLAIHDEPLIRDRVEAWEHGPVIPAIYDKFKKWGSGVIGRAPCKTVRFDERQIEVLDSVFKSYGKYCGYYLSQITHDDGKLETPWKQCYRPGTNARIPDEVTKRYYEKLISS